MALATSHFFFNANFTFSCVCVLCGKGLHILGMWRRASPFLKSLLSPMENVSGWTHLETMGGSSPEAPFPLPMPLHCRGGSGLLIGLHIAMTLKALCGMLHFCEK